MDLLLGSHVREHGNRVGRLAGFELEPATHCIRRLIISEDGDLGPQAVTRPLSAVTLVHQNGEIELRPPVEMAPLPAVPDVVMLNRATRLRSHDRDAGRFVGAEVNPADRAILTVFGRQHWWTRRTALPAKDLDFSTSGEIRDSSSGHRAA